MFFNSKNTNSQSAKSAHKSWEYPRVAMSTLKLHRKQILAFINNFNQENL